VRAAAKLKDNGGGMKENERNVKMMKMKRRKYLVKHQSRKISKKKRGSSASRSKKTKRRHIRRNAALERSASKKIKAEKSIISKENISINGGGDSWYVAMKCESWAWLYLINDSSFSLAALLM